MNKRGKFISRRKILFGLGGLAAVGALATKQLVQAVDNLKKDFQVTGKLSLSQRAAKKGLIYGAASRKIDLSSNPLYAAAIVQNCSLLVPEWEFKWTAGNVRLRPSPNRFDLLQQTGWLILLQLTICCYAAIPWYGMNLYLLGFRKQSTDKTQSKY